MQGAETKVITVDITDASTLQLALRYPYTGNCHDDGESRAVTHNFSRSEATQVEPNDGDPQDDLGGSRADALLPKGLEDEIDGSEGTVASTPQGKAMLMLLDTRDPQLHERLDQNREETGQESNGYHDPIEDRPKVFCSKARLRTNTLVYILADYIKVSELKALAVSKLADALEDDCQDDLGDVCHLVYTSISSTSWDLRSCLANVIASRGQSLINDAAIMSTALVLTELLRDSFSCVVRQH